MGIEGPGNIIETFQRLLAQKNSDDPGLEPTLATMTTGRRQRDPDDR